MREYNERIIKIFFAILAQLLNYVAHVFFSKWLLFLHKVIIIIIYIYSFINFITLFSRAYITRKISFSMIENINKHQYSVISPNIMYITEKEERDSEQTESYMYITINILP